MHKIRDGCKRAGVAIGDAVHVIKALILGIGLASSGSPASAAPVDRLEGIHRIAVISALGDTANVGVVGLTVLDSTGGDVPIKDWDLDGVATKRANELIGRDRQVVSVEVDKSQFTTDDEYSLYPKGNPSLRPLVRALPADKVDAYLVIRKSNWTAPQGLRYYGLGAVRYRSLRPYPPSVYASFDIDLVQAGTGKTLVHEHSSLNGDFKNMSAPEALGDWADKPSRMSPKQIDTLRANLAAVISDALSRSLAAMKLTAPQYAR